MIFHSKKTKKAIARFLVNTLKRKPYNVAKFLNVSRATIYRYIK